MKSANNRKGGEKEILKLIQPLRAMLLSQFTIASLRKRSDWYNLYLARTKAVPTAMATVSV